MAIKITPIDPGRPDALELIQAAEAEPEGKYPPEDQFGCSADQMRASDTWFYLARQDDEPVGCCGLQACGAFGEIKRLYVRPAVRGTDTAYALMSAIEARAKTERLGVLRLETGIHQHAALKFYSRPGYREIPPYGAYVSSATSICMEKVL